MAPLFSLVKKVFHNAEYLVQTLTKQLLFSFSYLAASLLSLSYLALTPETCNGVSQ